MTPGFQTLVNQVAHLRMSAIELWLVTEIEKIEGRVPSNDEVRRHGLIAVSPDGVRHYTWKGEILFTTDR